VTDEELSRDGILALAVEVHMSTNGSGDEPQPGVVAYLRKRLQDWTASHPSSVEFDEAVKAVVVVALKEIDRLEGKR
jgi:hypothetical protein